MISEVHVQRSIRDTASYLEYGSEDNKNKVEDRSERIAWEAGRNVLDVSMTAAVEQMHHTAETKGRRDLENRVYHVILSWQSGNEEKGIPPDDPSREEMEWAVDQVMDSLDLEDHQAWMVAHKDTDTPHVHVMVNRVHPRTGKAWERSYDKARLFETLRELEKERGWHGPEEDTIPEVWDQERPESLQYWEKEHEKWDREKSVRMWAREHLVGELLEAGSWREAERVVTEKGSSLEPRYDRGMVLEKDGRYVAMSSIDPRISRPKLEERYGQKWEAYLEHGAPAQESPDKEVEQEEPAEESPTVGTTSEERQSEDVSFRESLRQMSEKDLWQKRAELEKEVGSVIDVLSIPDHKPEGIRPSARGIAEDILEERRKELKMTDEEIGRRKDPPEEMSQADLLDQHQFLVEEKDRVRDQIDSEKNLPRTKGVRNALEEHQERIEKRIESLRLELSRRQTDQQESVFEALQAAIEADSTQEDGEATDWIDYQQSLHRAERAYRDLSSEDQAGVNATLSDEELRCLNRALRPDKISVEEARVLDALVENQARGGPDNDQGPRQVKKLFEQLSDEEKEVLQERLNENGEKLLNRALEKAEREHQSSRPKPRRDRRNRGGPSRW